MDAATLLTQLQEAKKLNDEHRGTLSSLRSDYDALMASTCKVMDESRRLQQQVEELQAINRELTHRLYGRRSERRPDSPGQGHLPFVQLEGDDRAERMVLEKPKAVIEVIRRRKYVVKGQPERGVLAAPPPLSIVEGCKYDFTVIGTIIANKYAFHQPTYRQQDWFAQCGWFPSRSTINELLDQKLGHPTFSVRTWWSAQGGMYRASWFPAEVCGRSVGNFDFVRCARAPGGEPESSRAWPGS